MVPARCGYGPTALPTAPAHRHGTSGHHTHEDTHEHEKPARGDEEGVHAVHRHAHGSAAHGHGHDHNLRGAYLHVLADATTSLLAIAALALGRTFGWTWPDAAVGLVGAVLVGRWAWGLVRDSGGVLLDMRAPAEVHERIRRAIEQGDDRVADLHVWSLGGHGYAAALSVVTHDPQPPEAYRAMIPADAGIVHATVEVHRCTMAEPSAAG